MTIASFLYMMAFTFLATYSQHDNCHDILVADWYINRCKPLSYTGVKQYQIGIKQILIKQLILMIYIFLICFLTSFRYLGIDAENSNQLFREASPKYSVHFLL